MLHACVRRFEVTGTVWIFSPTKQGLILQRSKVCSEAGRTHWFQTEFFRTWKLCFIFLSIFCTHIQIGRNNHCRWNITLQLSCFTLSLLLSITSSKSTTNRSGSCKFSVFRQAAPNLLDSNLLISQNFYCTLQYPNNKVEENSSRYHFHVMHFPWIEL